MPAAIIATPAVAQEVLQEPGAYLQAHPWANDYHFLCLLRDPPGLPQDDLRPAAGRDLSRPGWTMVSLLDHGPEKHALGLDPGHEPIFRKIMLKQRDGRVT
jgi:hypothetical protein